MEHKIIATYCLIDEMLKGLHVNNDVCAKITNAEVLIMAYLAVSDFNLQRYQYPDTKYALSYYASLEYAVSRRLER